VDTYRFTGHIQILYKPLPHTVDINQLLVLLYYYKNICKAHNDSTET